MEDKDYLGMQLSVVFNMDEGYDEGNAKTVLKFLGKYNLEKTKESEAFDIKTIEYDAGLITEEWEEIEASAKEEIPFAKIGFYEGEYNEETDDFYYDYQSLFIDI